jgi:prepilin-type N-terminal cleavage/methylation domain-containing protein
MKKSGFTLIELLIVVSIIIILIGLTSSGVMVALRKTKENRARTEVMNLLTAVKLYQSEVGVLPKDITEKYLGKGLTKNDVYGGTTPGGVVFGPYYEFKDSNSEPVGTDRALMDPWNTKYEYVLANVTPPTDLPSEGKTAVGNGFSVVYSKGPTGNPDKDVDINDTIGTWQ